VEDEFIAADGTITKVVADQAIQLGDGGWGIIAEAQAYRRIAWRLNAYALGSYLVSPREKTLVPSPLAGVFWSVPDVYLARAGFAVSLLPSGRASMNLGLRLDGTPVRDLVGGNDGFRRPAHALYGDPGAAMRFGRHEVTVSMPFRIQQEFERSLIFRERNLRQGGDLAGSLLFVGYGVRL